MTIKTPLTKPPNANASATLARPPAMPHDVEDRSYQRMPPKRIDAMRVRYVKAGKGLPRPYRMDD
jgi:hypothetical protein